MGQQRTIFKRYTKMIRIWYLSFVKILCKTRVREKTPLYREKTPFDWVKTPLVKSFFWVCHANHRFIELKGHHWISFTRLSQPCWNQRSKLCWWKKLMEQTDGMEWDYGFRILQGWSTWFKHLIDISSELVMETPANVFKPEPLGHNIFEPFLEL